MPIYTLPDLKYDYGELEPHLSAKILQLHHDKHHLAYVNGANETLDKLADARKSGELRRHQRAREEPRLPHLRPQTPLDPLERT